MFEKNLQGDIIAVYTEGGTKIGSYTYDAWGVCSYSYASGATSAQKQIVSTLNPFRYRGYYYDTETGFYYLQTRYYNPQWGRFLNADGYVNANGDLIGFNMFTYCSNNPIQYIDPFGDAYLPFSLLTYPGEIHMQVLLNLKEEYGFTIENSIEGFLLRIDAIDPNSKGLAKDAYEIKPVTYRRDFMLLQAVWQLDNYIVLSNFKYKPGTREICNTFDYKNFVVTYWLEGPGIIVYTFVSKPTEVKVESHSHFPVPLLPKRDESREISANLGAAAAMVFAYAVMKMPQQKLKKECFNGW